MSMCCCHVQPHGTRPTSRLTCVDACPGAAAQLDGQALLMLDDQGLMEDIPIGVRAHRAVVLKKIDLLRREHEGGAPAGGALVAVGGRGGGLAEALAIMKRELAAAQQENFELREAVAVSATVAPLK
jgi:hypothetical protein